MKYLIRFKLYSYYSWGLPLVLVGIAHLLDHMSRLVFDLSIFSTLFSLAFLSDYKPKYEVYKAREHEAKVQQGIPYSQKKQYDVQLVDYKVYGVIEDRKILCNENCP